MIRPGLTSITFRKLPAAEIVRWAAEAGLDGVEWGGDIHVPHGQVDTARRVAAMTREAGLVVASYGSYYRLGQEPPDLLPAVLDTAQALGAPIVRVWAGRRGSDDADAGFRAQVAEDGRRAAELAEEANVRIATEWHGRTLTDTGESAAALFAAVGHPGFRTYWQPRGRMSVEESLRDMDAAMPRLAGLHVYHCDGATGERRPLEEGAAPWKAYLAKAAGAGDMFALLEFVIDDDPRRMLGDAATLRQWLAGQDQS